MAQSEKPTYQGYIEVAKRMSVAGDGTGSCVNSVVGYIDTCSAAAEASTYASPAATMCNAAGFALVDADIVNTITTANTDDTTGVFHVFTATAANTITGFGICNDDDDVLFAECCFAAGVPCETDDTLTVSMAMQFKLGS